MKNKKNQKNRIIKAAAVFLVLCISLAQGSAALAAVTTPATINYQGRLLNSSDVPLSGNYVFRMSIWNSADWQATDTTVGGAVDITSPRYAGWQETHNVTPDTFGLFNIDLGSVTGFPNFTSATHAFLQVEVKLNGDPDTNYEILDPQGTTADVTDRKTLHKEAYAENADTIDNAEIGTAAGNIPTLGVGGILGISTIPGGTNADSFVVDNNDTSLGDILLQFGAALAKTLKYSQLNSWFEFNGDVSFGNNEIKNVVIENRGAAPGGPAAGQIYHNTGDGNTYIWNGASWDDITAGASGADDLDGVYGADADKKMAVNNASGLEFESSVAGNMIFDLQSTGDLVVQDAGVTYAVFSDTGTFDLDNLRLDGNTVSSTNLNGNITLDPNGIGKAVLSADTDIEGTAFTLDSDNAIAGADIDIVANQGSDSDGTLRYSAANDRWEISNNGGAYQKVISGTVGWADIAARAKSAVFGPEFNAGVLNADGGANRGKMATDFVDNGGASKINYYEWTTQQAAIQDMDIVIKFTLPDDFASFTGAPLSVIYQTSDGVAGTNKIDVSLEDSAGAAVALTGAANLANAAWTTAAITFGGAPTFTAGTTVTLKIKTSSTSAGFARVGNITFNYNGK